MHIVTDYVLPDEPCHGLAEGPLQVPDPSGKGMHRRWVQRVFVVRDEAIAKHLIDLGPAEDWEGRSSPQIIGSFGDDSVAQLQEFAEVGRYDDRYRQLAQQIREESTLIEDSIAGLEQERLAKRNRTTIGPNVFSQRGDYPSQFAQREAKERNNGRS